MSFAMLVTWNKDVRHQNNWYGHYIQPNDGLMIRIETSPAQKGKYWQAVGAVQALFHQQKWTQTVGNIHLLVSIDSQQRALQYGDVLFVRSKLQLISQATNPGGFNYRVYMARQQIYHNIRVSPTQCRRIAEQQGSWISAFVLQAREMVLDQLDRYVHSGSSIKGIAEALLIGYKENLDGKLMQSYSNTGLVHIIAISGLHLGVIYIILLFVLEKIPFIKRLPFVKWPMVLLLLWLFALMTGGSASVLRSAVMFSCIIIGKLLGKNASVEQSLAVSAGLLLAYNPCLLWDVGFQLSYLAIMGIVSTQLFFQGWWSPRSKVFQKIWTLTSVTLAAQVFTFPICIYYFHQFPNLFFLSNLIIVPLSTLVLFGLLLLIVLSPFEPVAVWLGKSCSVLIEVMNGVVQAIDSVPGSVLQPIYANVYTTLALYGFVISLCYWWLHSYNRAALYALGSFFIFLGAHAIVRGTADRQLKIIVYHIPKKSGVDVLYHQQCKSIGRSDVSDVQAVKTARIFFHAWQVCSILPSFSQKNSVFSFVNAHWMVLDRNVQLPSLPPSTCLDFVVLSNNAPVSIQSIHNAIHPSIIVFDASNSLWKIVKWKKECEALLLPCYSIPERGAFVYSVS